MYYKYDNFIIYCNILNKDNIMYLKKLQNIARNKLQFKIT